MEEEGERCLEIYTDIYVYKYIICIIILYTLKLFYDRVEYQLNWRIKSDSINLHVIFVTWKAITLTNVRYWDLRKDPFRRKFPCAPSLRQYPVIIGNRRRSRVMQIIRSNRPRIRFSRCMNVPWIPIRAPGRYGGCNVTSLVTVRTLRTNT